jgi:hypothetical protein
MGQGPINTTQQPYQGTKVVPGITAATVVKASGGRVMSINVNVTNGTTTVPAFTIYDSSTLAGTATANVVYASAPEAPVGVQIDLDFPVTSGIVVVPTAPANVAVSYL